MNAEINNESLLVRRPIVERTNAKNRCEVLIPSHAPHKIQKIAMMARYRKKMRRDSELVLWTDRQVWRYVSALQASQKNPHVPGSNIQQAFSPPQFLNNLTKIIKPISLAHRDSDNNKK